MAWTEITHREYERQSTRYASDVTDEEWHLILPLLPPDRRLGRPRKTDIREVVNALLYIGTTGCQWRFLPKDFPPFQRYRNTSTGGVMKGSCEVSIIVL